MKHTASDPLGSTLPLAAAPMAGGPTTPADGLVHAMKGAGDVVRTMAAQAEQILTARSQTSL